MQATKCISISTGLAASTIFGRRMVKIDSRPSSLSIVISRPHHLTNASADGEIKSGASLLLAVVAEAWENCWNSLLRPFTAAVPRFAALASATRRAWG
jgi:aspartate aminotransferase-like enzyme